MEVSPKQYWNSSNTASAINQSIHVKDLKIPIGVFSALRSQYGDISESKNDDNLRWIAYDNWTFTTVFDAIIDNEQKVNLTLHGIDTISSVYLNSHLIGTTENMFVRYSFDVVRYLKTANILEIKIISPIFVAKARAEKLLSNGINVPPKCPHNRNNGECHRNMLRKMQASFGGNSNLAAPSMGIWKPIQLEYFDLAIMRDVDVAIRRNNTHWTLDMIIFLSTDIKTTFNCEIVFKAQKLLNQPLIFKRVVSYNSPEIKFKVDIPKERVKLWWPNGYGEQKLYTLFFVSNCWLNKDSPRIISRTKSQKTIDIGFRTIELEEDLDDFGRTFYFKVNDQPIFVKGANYMPSDILPENLYQENKLQHIFKSAKETHLNMIRVWGGGLYETDIFYDLADFYGLLVWQDLPFTASTYPLTDTFLESVRLEVSQNAQRIGFHPSLCMLVINDEIELYLAKNKTEFGMDLKRLEEEYKQMFMGTIRQELNIISRNGFNPRAGPMISTPSMGVKESENELSNNPQNPNYGDVHFWEEEEDGWDPAIYPKARFITRYGFQSLSILASWNRSFSSNYNLSDIIQHRQHNPKGFGPMLKLISRHFTLPTIDWEKNIDILIYLSQLSQAIATKTATEVFRTQRANKRTMGAMYWQLNDNWVAPTSSSIDYYGNYKIVWYWSKEFMAPTSIIALMDIKNSKINITVTKEEVANEIKEPTRFNVTMYIYLWSELFHKKSITWEIPVGSNGIHTEYLDMKAVFNKTFTRNNCFLKFALTQSNKTISSTYVIPDEIANSDGIVDPQLMFGVTSQYCLKTNVKYFLYCTITITVKRPALFVYLEINHPDIDKYKLSENGMIMTDPIRVVQVQIELKSQNCITLTKNDVRIITINELLFSNSADYNTESNILSTLTPTTETGALYRKDEQSVVKVAETL